jgi:hypothetical protein
LAGQQYAEEGASRVLPPTVSLEGNCDTLLTRPVVDQPALMDLISIELNG